MNELMKEPEGNEPPDSELMETPEGDKTPETEVYAPPKRQSDDEDDGSDSESPLHAACAE